MKNIVALDIGGTAVKYCCACYTDNADRMCEIRDGKKVYGQWTIRGDLPSEIREFLKGRPFDCLAVSIPGPFDFSEGISHMQHKLPSLLGVSLREVALSVNPDASVEFFHDAAAFALGVVSCYGKSNFAAVMLGTGLGYVVVKNKKPLVKPCETPQNSLWSEPYREGIAENYVSGSAIKEGCRAAGYPVEEVKQAADMARNGCKAVEEIFYKVGQDLGSLVEKRRYTDGFDRLFIGGQIVKAFDLLKTGFEEKTDISYVCVDEPEKMALYGLLSGIGRKKEDLLEFAMKKILIITGDRVDDSEVLYPYYRMQEEGYQVDVASFAAGDIEAKHGYKIHAAYGAEDIQVSDYSGLILPGGLAPEKLRQSKEVLAIVRGFFDRGLPIAAICHGPQILISAKVLNGVKATCYPGIREDLINADAVYEDKSAVTDHNVVTSRRPEDLPAFMKAFLSLLADKL